MAQRKSKPKGQQTNPNPVTTSVDPLMMAAGGTVSDGSDDGDAPSAAQEAAAEKAKADAEREEREKEAAAKALAAEKAKMSKPTPPPKKAPRFIVSNPGPITISFRAQQIRLTPGTVVSDERFGPGGMDRLKDAGVKLRPENEELSLDDDFNEK